MYNITDKVLNFKNISRTRNEQKQGKQIPKTADKKKQKKVTNST